MPRPGGTISRRTAAEAYGVLRCLSLEKGIAGKPLVAAQEALLARGLAEGEMPSREHDQRMLQDCRQSGDRGAFLCLRCRVSWPIEQRVRSLHRQNARNYGVELLALAACVLDDTGRLLTYMAVPEREGRRRPADPFGVEVIRSYQPERSALSTWAQQKLMGHPPLRDYLNRQGVQLITDWALLADTSQKQVAEAVSRFDGRITPDAAQELHRAYLPLYRQAKLMHWQKTGRQQGWEPDEGFLGAVDPARPPAQTMELLERIAKALRHLKSGRWLKQEAALLEGGGRERPAHAAEAGGHGDDGVGQDDQQIARLVDEVGMEYAATLISSLQPEGRERRIWQAWAEGLPQRQIAERCSTSEARVTQSDVSRLVQERRRAEEIATMALERMRHALPEQATAAQARLFCSLEELQEAERRLMNHLRKPEQQGAVSPLRRWVQHALQAPAAGTEAEAASGGER